MALKAGDPVYRGDVVQAGRDSTLGITFDDETTFTLTANARVAINDFVYRDGAKGSALFNVARGTVAFVASQIAKTGDMKISTPTSTLGIRGTTGVVEIPEGGDDHARIKLYPDANGSVGRIEVFNLDGGRLGTLSRGSTAFAIRSAGPSRFAAISVAISPQEAARDRNVVRQLFSTHNTGRQMINQRRQLRQPGLQRRPTQQKQPALPKQPALQKQNQRTLQPEPVLPREPRQLQPRTRQPASGRPRP